MGVHVILDIEPRGIEAPAWAAVHDETLALLEAWRPRLLGWGVRSIEGVRVPMYTRSIRGDEDDPKEVHWSVVGDRESLQTAECQSLYRDLRYYRERRGRRAQKDIVVAAARPDREDTGGPERVFGDKTQGCPYHFAMLAAAMLVEERFPRHAMTWGDIDRGQAEEARRMAAPILGRELPLPVRVDGARLIERLRGDYDANALPGAFERVFLGEPDEVHEAVLRAFPGDEGVGPWLRALARHKTPDTLGVVGLLAAWLNAGRDLGEACRLACLAEEGPRFSPEGLVDALASTWVGIPRSAREPLDVFRKPEGASHTVASLLGGFFLDISAMGRHLRVHLEPTAIEGCLSAVFGDDGPALAARLGHRSAKIEAELRACEDDMGRFVARAGEEASDDTEALSAIGSVDAMGKNQRTWVQGMAWSAMKVLAKLRKGDRKVAATLARADRAKTVLARMLAEQTPTLTEDAWDAILAEHDAEVIAWWVALMSMDAGELHASQVRRAFFENAEIRRYAIAVGRDDQAMREIGQLVADARAHKVGQRHELAPSPTAPPPARRRDAGAPCRRDPSPR